jgi:hypothetical protein
MIFVYIDWESKEVVLSEKKYIPLAIEWKRAEWRREWRAAHAMDRPIAMAATDNA